MKQVQRILLSTLLILISFVVYQQKTDLVSLRTEVNKQDNFILEMIKLNANADMNVAQSVAKITADVYTKFDLSVLDSCGLVNYGNGSFGFCVVVRSDLILTAGHCIYLEYENLHVIINECSYNVINQWKSDKYDVGFMLLDVGDRSLIPISFGSMPNILDVVYLIGSPYNKIYSNTITKGVISKLKVDISLYNTKWIDLIQTDAEGAPGSSGGPLFNSDGQIIGICVTGPNPGGGVTCCAPVIQIKEALEDRDKCN